MSPSCRRLLQAVGSTIVRLPSTETGTEAEAGRELLNSERIERRFGSYGVQVLRTEGPLRVSNLYSLTDGIKTCRTYARVTFTPTIDPAYAAEHARVLAGASIGTVFRAAGWTIAKRHRHIGETTLPGGDHGIARLMRLEGRPTLATDTYVFEIVKDGQRFEYAEITELHPPAYLAAATLASIYGESAIVDVP